MIDLVPLLFTVGVIVFIVVGVFLSTMKLGKLEGGLETGLELGNLWKNLHKSRDTVIKERREERLAEKERLRQEDEDSIGPMIR